MAPPIDIIAIEQEARRLRAEEMRRLGGICAAYMAVYARALGAGVLAIGKVFGEALRLLFSWIPHGDHKARLS